MTLIGLISDTHGMLRREVAAALAGVDHILHAGDAGKREVLNALRNIAPLTAVRGNVDSDGWAESLRSILSSRSKGTASTSCITCVI